MGRATAWRTRAYIVETKKAYFEPDRFEGRYEEALKEPLKKKQSGQKIEAPREREPSKAINLMDALRRSGDTERGVESGANPCGPLSNHRTPKRAGR